MSKHRPPTSEKNRRSAHKQCLIEIVQDGSLQSYGCQECLLLRFGEAQGKRREKAVRAGNGRVIDWRWRLRVFWSPKVRLEGIILSMHSSESKQVTHEALNLQCLTSSHPEWDRYFPSCIPYAISPSNMDFEWNLPLELNNLVCAYSAAKAGVYLCQVGCFHTLNEKWLPWQSLGDRQGI